MRLSPNSVLQNDPLKPEAFMTQAQPTMPLTALVPMDLFNGDEALRIDLAYAQPAPKSFCGIIYRPEARLWLHQDLAAITVLAARLIYNNHKLHMVLYDGLRTVCAQELIRDTPVVQANPQWLEGDARLLSPPGRGAHPRGMAIDLSLESADGQLLDMGTAFDALATGGSGPLTNPAHRDYARLSAAVTRNRAILTGAMQQAAALLALPLLPLPQEWWDFRLPAEIYDNYAPLADHDLPPQMRMTAKPATPGAPADFPADHFDELKQQISARIAPFAP